MSIKGFALEITRFLVDRGAKVVVMACNMSSAVALETARERFPDVPIMGMIEPGARAAVKVANGRPIGVLATTGTINNGAYERAIHKLDPALRSGRAGVPEVRAVGRIRPGRKRGRRSGGPDLRRPAQGRTLFHHCARLHSLPVPETGDRGGGWSGRVNRRSGGGSGAGNWRAC